MKRARNPTQYASGYSLDLYCDQDNAAHPLGFKHSFSGETFSDCAKDARKRGWIIHRKTRTATCPVCMKEKQEAGLRIVRAALERGPLTVERHRLGNRSHVALEHWRCGKRLFDSAHVNRLIASGEARREGDRVFKATNGE